MGKRSTGSEVTGRGRISRAKAEVAAKLKEAGCLFCRERSQAEDRFFVWYLAENYLFPESIHRMVAARGFCPRHTRVFLQKGIPSTIAYVYRVLAAAAADQVREVEAALHGARRLREVGDLLIPTGACPACAQEEDHSAYLRHLVASTLAAPEVRAALVAHPTVCLPHFRELAPVLHRDGLLFVARSLRNQLEARELDRSLVWGAMREGWPGPAPGPEREQARAERLSGGWSPTADLLRRLVSATACPVCRAEAAATARYVAWLSQEILAAPPYQWENALWLCPEHGWRFATTGDPEAVARLSEAVQALWRERLEKLATALEGMPRGGFIRRWVQIPERLRARPDSSVARRLLAALKEALVPPRWAVAAHRERELRTSPCPLCRHLAVVAERTCDLLVRGLGDPAVRAAYEGGSGLCMRHLPLALSLARRAAEAAVLVHTARVRLEMVEWELEEFLRKQNWLVRYELTGVEGGAWQRAVALLSGVPLEP
ncbi:MAG: hypothetical protein ACUVQS_01710 [Candidatus Bipolaricaulaceae bacterium]